MFFRLLSVNLKFHLTGVSAMNRVMTRKLRFGGFLGLLLGAAAVVESGEGVQPLPSIALDPSIECWYDSAFPVVGAVVSPPEDIVRSRLYFRCSLYQDYYFVDLTSDGTTFHGVAPQAEESCPQVYYYVEAMSRDFSSARTAERRADVTSPNECRRRFPAAAWFPGDDPKIYLGSLGSQGMAPGFKSLGVAGFVTSTGTIAATSTSGGISTGAVAGIAAGGAAAGIGILAAGGSSSTTTVPQVLPPPPAPTTTTGPATTTTPPAGPPGFEACFEMTPPDGVVGINEPLKIDGRCSKGTELTFHFDLGDGRVKEGQAFITAIWSSPGSYDVTLTITGSPATFGRTGQTLAEDTFTRRVTVEPPPEPVKADFTAGNIAPDICKGEFDGSTSTGNISRYVWDLDLENSFGLGVIRREGRVVVQNWDDRCYRPQGFLMARLTVEGVDGSEDSIEKRVNILQSFRSTTEAETIQSSFETEMLEGDGARGQVMIEGGPAFPVSGSTPVITQYNGRRGSNALEVTLLAPASNKSPVLWRFDFSGARGFLLGSLRVTSGQQVSRDGQSVVLRFSGASGERAKIEYRLER